MRGRADVNHVTGLVVPERDAVDHLLVVRQVREVEFRSAHHGRHVVVPARHEHFQERVLRHRLAQRLGLVHVAVLHVGPRPHVAGRWIAEVALPFQIVLDVVLEERGVRALQRRVRGVELLPLAGRVEIEGGEAAIEPSHRQPLIAQQLFAKTP